MLNVTRFEDEMRLSVHYLRGVAALSIVLLHAILQDYGRGHWAEPLLHGGVDLFFVISGFVIFTSTRGAFDWRNYAAKRFVRIMPLLWAAGLLFLLAVPILHLTVPSLSRIVTGFLLIPTPRADGRITLIIPVSWTLAYEVYFYAVFGVAMALGRWWLAPIALTVMIAAGAMFDLGPTMAAYYANSMLAEFLFGMFIAWWLHSGRSLPVWLLPLGAVLVIAASYGIGSHGQYRGLWKGLPVAVLVAGALAVEARHGLPRIPALFFLGSASYSIYLFHMVPMMALTEGGVDWWMAHFAVGSAIGILAFLYVERPMLGAIKAARPRQATTFSAVE